MDIDKFDLLIHVVAEVLERYAFMFADPVAPSDIPKPRDDLYRAAIRFEGPHKGEIVIVTTQSACIQLTANVLGADPSGAALEMGQDSLKELINVICGDFLEKLAGAVAVFNLGIPELTRLPARQWESLILQPGTRALTIDEVPLLIQATLD